MTSFPSSQFTIFVGDRLAVRGDMLAVAKAAYRLNAGEYLVLSDETGRPFDLDLRGTATDVAARYHPGPQLEERRRGRPKLGVTAREVTLLPRHWDWLAAQPGGASAALRRLVDDARRTGGAALEVRATQDRVYRAMTALCGDRPGYEEAVRALFAGDRAAYGQLSALWPIDLRDYLQNLWR